MGALRACFAALRRHLPWRDRPRRGHVLPLFGRRAGLGALSVAGCALARHAPSSPLTPTLASLTVLARARAPTAKRRLAWLKPRRYTPSSSHRRPLVTGSADSSAAIGVPGGMVFIHGGGVALPPSPAAEQRKAPSLSLPVGSESRSGGSGVTTFFSPDGQRWKPARFVKLKGGGGGGGRMGLKRTKAHNQSS